METGDFSPAKHPVPMCADFANFDRSLNEITSKVADIVAQQTKAEHLRTELITNVSHDLKTPLTSIVNYVDLLSREPMQTETASEYLEVLRRQAARLKKLTIDLVDASKASTGNLNVELMPTDIQVLLSQIAGEYEEQLANKSLSLILNTTEEPLMILADGRQIWRVFDNLLNNACKYALTGTRVYLDVKTKDDHVTISLKNVSAHPLNISPDELMERFVRGDASRHTEGSGLGLSIARDLTALQNGILRLSTDGDLFKAHLTFPLYHPPEIPETPAESAPVPEIA
jgi:signal transduction histidine kinase